MTLPSESLQVLKISEKLLLKIIIVLWGTIIVFLALSDIFINHYEWVDSGPIQRLVNITRDDGLPNWFSSIQLLAVSVVLWLILFGLVYSKPNLIRKKTEKLGWGLCALFFTYLAVDDGSKMHERVGTAFSDSIQARHEYNPTFISNLFDVFPSYGWQFVFVPFFGLVSVFILLFLLHNLKTKKQLILIFLGFSCYATSVVLDFAEGMDVKVYDALITFFDTDLHTIQHFSKLIEEVFEMVGNTFFMLAFTKQLMNLAQNWKIQFIDLINKEDRIK